MCRLLHYVSSRCILKTSNYVPIPYLCRHPESNKYCVFHQIYANSASVKMPKEVKKESSSMKEVKKELKKLYPLFLAKHPNCEVRLSPECTKKATCIHHVHGRLKDNILNQKTWRSACEKCNGWVEDNHMKAELAGMKKSKFTTVK